MNRQLLSLTAREIRVETWNFSLEIQNTITGVETLKRIGLSLQKMQLYGKFIISCKQKNQNRDITVITSLIPKPGNEEIILPQAL